MLKRQAGFIITIELLLITTILIIGLSVGIVQIRDALVKRQAAQQNNQVTVVDSQNRPLGRAFGLDEHEAPLLAYIDNTDNIDNQNATGRAFIGVRDDRFTSREPVFYDGPNCTGNPCLKGVSDESYNLSVGGIAQSGSVSYINALQGDTNYAIGRASGESVQGILMRSSQQMCPADINQIQSIYLSQKVISGMPCEPFSPPELEADNSCLVGVNSLSNIGLINGGIGNGNGNGNISVVDLPTTCSQCPTGSTSQGDILDNYLPQVEPLVNSALSILSSAGVIANIDVTLGEVCCPENSQINDQTTLTDALVFVAIEQTLALLEIDLRSQPAILDLLSSVGINPAQVFCVPNIQLNYADSVAYADAPNVNVLEQFQGPFSVRVPQQSASDWYYVPPNGEGNLYTQPQN